MSRSQSHQWMHSYQDGCPHFTGALWKLFVTGLLLLMSGDIEINPGPNSRADLGSNQVSEGDLYWLAERFPYGNYPLFCHILCGMVFPTSEAILAKHCKDFKQATREVLAIWKTDTGGKWDDLKAALQNSGAGGIADDIEQRMLSRRSQAKPDGPLTADELARCKQEIMDHYRTYLCKIRADPLTPNSDVDFEELFTTLNLCIRDEHDSKKRKDLDYDDILKIRVNQKLPRRLILQGEAGAGKTTLCAKIAWDWITGRLFEEYEMVLVVPLREADGFSIGDVAKAYLADTNPVTASQLDGYIQANPIKVFLVLDGLDEFKEWSKWNNSVAVSQPQESGDLVPIVLSKKLTACLVLVTSRPWKAEEVKWNRSSKVRMAYYAIDVEGFSTENLALYINKFFKGHPRGDEKSRTLNHFTKENDVIAEYMALRPIYCAMLCLMWRELDEYRCEAIRHLHTFSQVFNEMFFFLKEHYALKITKDLGDDSLNVHLKNITEDLDVINEIAFNGLLKNNLVFDEDDFKSCENCLETALKVGVLSQEKNMALKRQRHDINARRLQTKVVFPHKLFQEFMAGMYVVGLFKKDFAKYTSLVDTRVMPNKEDFRYLLYFTASQVADVEKEQGTKEIGKDIVERLIKKFGRKKNYKKERGGEILHLPPQVILEKQQDFIVDVAFEVHDKIVARMVKEKFLPKAMTLSVSHEKTSHTITGYLFLQLNLTKLAFEWRPNCGLTLSRELAQVIYSSPSLEEVILKTSNFHAELYEILAKNAKKSSVRSLNLHNMNLTAGNNPSPSSNLVLFLCGAPRLTKLALTGMVFHDSFYSTMKAKASSIRIQSMVLSDITLHENPKQPVDLAYCLCLLPNLVDLRFEKYLDSATETSMYVDILDDFYLALEEIVYDRDRTFFPQLSKGKFKFNGQIFYNRDSVMQAFRHYQSHARDRYSSLQPPSDRSYDGMVNYGLDHHQGYAMHGAGYAGDYGHSSNLTQYADHLDESRSARFGPSPDNRLEASPAHADLSMSSHGAACADDHVGSYRDPRRSNTVRYGPSDPTYDREFQSTRHDQTFSREAESTDNSGGHVSPWHIPSSAYHGGSHTDRFGHNPGAHHDFPTMPSMGLYFPPRAQHEGDVMNVSNVQVYQDPDRSNVVRFGRKSDAPHDFH